MHGVGEHVHRLHGRNAVIPAQDGQITRLRGRIATDIDHALGCGLEDNIGHIRVNARPRRIQDDDIRFSVLLDEFFVEDILHVTGKEAAIGDSIGRCIEFGVLDGLRNILNSNYFGGFPAHELGDGSGAGIQVIHHLIARQGGKFARYAV